MNFESCIDTGEIENAVLFTGQLQSVGLILLALPQQFFFKKLMSQGGCWFCSNS